MPSRSLTLAVLAVLAVGCSSEEPETTQDDTNTTSTTEPAETSKDVQVTISCERGDQLSSSPFDIATIPFVADAPDDTAWIRQVVSVENPTEKSVQVETGTTVRYLDADGEVLGEALLDEPFAAAVSASPGQTVNRSVVRFDVDTQMGLVADETLNATLFDQLGSCEIASTGDVTSLDISTLIDPAFEGSVELGECGLSDDGRSYGTTLTVTNPGDEPTTVEATFEILSGTGDRLGIGGTGGAPTPIGPGETVEIEGSAAAFTVLDIDEAIRCELLTVTTS